jgi:hypothetical protein
MFVWKSPWGRKACATVIFLAAALIQVFFKDVPWPIRVENSETLRSASAPLAAQEIVISQAKVSPHHTFLKYEGNPSETVDLDFDRAALGPATTTTLAAFPPGPPAAPAPWHLVSHEDRAAPDGETCRAFLDIEVTGDVSRLNEFHLLQLGQPGLNHMRQIEIRTDAASLAVNFKTEWPDGKQNKALGCRKRLQSGDWFRGIVNQPLQFVVAPYSTFRIDFVSLSPSAPAWGGPDKPFKSAELGPLLARKFTVRKIREDGTQVKVPPQLHILAYSHSYLKVKDLEIDSDAVQVSLSGRGWVKLNGSAQGFDLWDAMEKNAMFAALLTSGNALLLAWLRSLFFGGSAKPQLKEAEGPAEAAG